MRGWGHEHSFCLVSAVVSSLLSVLRWVLYSLLSAERQYCRMGRSSCPTSKISWSSFVNLEWRKRGNGGHIIWLGTRLIHGRFIPITTFVHLRYEEHFSHCMQLKLCGRGRHGRVWLPLILLGKVQMPHLRELVQDFHFAGEANDNDSIHECVV